MTINYIKRDINHKKRIAELFKEFNIYYNRGDFHKCLKKLDAIKNINNQQENLYYFYALTYLINNDTKKAKKYLLKEININPKNNKAKLLLKKIEEFERFPFATLILILILLFNFYYINHFQNLNFLSLLKFSYYKGAIFFNLITSIFIHYSLLHITLNIFFLILFGVVAEKRVGSITYLITFLISGIIGNFVQSLVTDNFILGSSGSIFGILGLLVILTPDLEVKLFGFLKTKLIYLFGAYFVIMNFINFDKLNFFGSNSANLSHLFGFITGMFLASIFYVSNIINFYRWFLFYMFFYLLSNLTLFLLKTNKDIYKIALNVISLILLIIFIYKYEGQNKENEV